MESQNRQLGHADHQPARALRPLCIVAEHVALPANVGSLFRIADAFGVEKLYLTAGSAVPPHPKLHKTARSCERAVAWEYRESAAELVATLRAEGYCIVCLERSTHSRDLRGFDARGIAKLALLVGSEKRGVSAELLSAADHTLHIRMLGQNSSLNLATACAIGVFELSRHQLPE
ncbi:MAG TPA: TrmH family RNA methyltransferase [Polyangiales bacterium]|nr:TrmH family RNA methyltransferase [Polyangiales bacterium]